MIPEWVQSDYMPGFAISMIVVFIFAFVVSKIGNIVVILILFALSISTLVDESIGTIGKLWVFSGWAGALTYFLGLHYLVVRFFGGFKERMKSGPSRPSREQARPEREPQRDPHREAEEMRHRREAFQRANDAFAERERQREREEAHRAERAREAFERAEREAYEEARRYANQSREEEHQRSQQEQQRQRQEQARREQEAQQRRQREQRERERQQKRRSEPKADSTNWWEVLGVPRTADMAEIKKAHRNLVKQYHPDRVDSLGDEFKAMAEAKMKAINAAYQEAKNLKG